MEKGDQTTATKPESVSGKPAVREKLVGKNMGIHSKYVSRSVAQTGGTVLPSSDSRERSRAKTFASVEPDPAWNQSGLNDPLSPPVQSVPAAMRMGAQMVLHSHLGINLFRGRRSDPQRNLRPIVGLARFARQVALVWSASEMDDPFADQCLVDIETTYDKAKHLLDAREQTLGDIIDGLDGLSIGIQTSTKPAEIDLQFFCPWAYKATLLLIQFDRIVRLALTARHIGVMGDQDWDAVVSDSARVLRHLFSLPNRWINTGVTREDCRKKTRVAKRALGMYAEVKEPRIELSESVLAGEVRATLAPHNKLLEKYVTMQAAKKQAV